MQYKTSNVNLLFYAQNNLSKHNDKESQPEQWHLINYWTGADLISANLKCQWDNGIQWIWKSHVEYLHWVTGMCLYGFFRFSIF